MTHGIVHTCHFCGNPLEVSYLSDTSSLLIATCLHPGCQVEGFTTSLERHPHITETEIQALAANVAQNSQRVAIIDGDADVPDVHVDTFARAIVSRADSEVRRAIAAYGEYVAQHQTPDRETTIEFLRAMTQAAKRNILIGYADITARMSSAGLEAFEDAIASRVYAAQ